MNPKFLFCLLTIVLLILFIYYKILAFLFSFQSLKIIKLVGIFSNAFYFAFRLMFFDSRVTFDLKTVVEKSTSINFNSEDIEQQPDIDINNVYPRQATKR